MKASMIIAGRVRSVSRAPVFMRLSYQILQDAARLERWEAEKVKSTNKAAGKAAGASSLLSPGARGRKLGVPGRVLRSSLLHTESLRPVAKTTSIPRVCEQQKRAPLLNYGPSDFKFERLNAPASFSHLARCDGAKSPDSAVTINQTACRSS